jgi:hypothetical protein
MQWWLVQFELINGGGGQAKQGRAGLKLAPRVESSQGPERVAWDEGHHHSSSEAPGWQERNC